MSAATLVPVHAIEEEDLRSEVSRLRRALERIAQTAVDLRADLPDTPDVPRDLAEGACSFLGGMAQAALR